MFPDGKSTTRRQKSWQKTSRTKSRMEVLIVRGRMICGIWDGFPLIHSELHDEMQVEDSSETPRNGHRRPRSNPMWVLWWESLLEMKVSPIEDNLFYFVKWGQNNSCPWKDLLMIARKYSKRVFHTLESQIALPLAFTSVSQTPIHWQVENVGLSSIVWLFERNGSKISVLCCLCPPWYRGHRRTYAD